MMSNYLRFVMSNIRIIYTQGIRFKDWSLITGTEGYQMGKSRV